MKNVCKKRLLKFITLEPEAWTAALVSAKLANSALSSFDIWSIPLNPLAHPRKVVAVLDVYVITSLSIFNKP